jgi:hypothetical protein
VDVLSDMAVSSLITPEDVTIERAAVLDPITVNGGPADPVHEVFATGLFGTVAGAFVVEKVGALVVAQAPIIPVARSPATATPAWEAPKPIASTTTPGSR